MSDLAEILNSFVIENGFKSTGSLCVAIVITEKVRGMVFPVDSEAFKSKGSGGQIAGLNKEAVQKVLRRHGITRTLSQMGGRTNRGSIRNNSDYVRLLNQLYATNDLRLDEIESFWVDRVRRHFASKPFKLQIDPSQGLRVVVRNVLAQAAKRQMESAGTQYMGAVMQHLIGAKLACSLPGIALEHHSFSTSDAQTYRAGDFLIGDTAIHVTTTPTEALVQRCKENIDQALRPVVVTTNKGAVAIDQLAENAGVADRIDVFEVEQFVTLNIYELGKFETSAQRNTLLKIVEEYNAIVARYETDPSLSIENR